MLVVAEDRPGGADLEGGAQAAQPPGVLGRDDVRAGDLLREPGRGVPRVADGGGREDEDAGSGSGSHPRILSGPPVQSPAAHPALGADHGRAAGVSSTTSAAPRTGEHPGSLPTMAPMSSTEQVRARLLGQRPTDVLWGWLAPLLVAAVGGFLRFWQLGRPHQLVFDETYYVKQAWSLLQFGTERRVPDTIKKPDVMFTNGTPGRVRRRARPRRAPAGRQVGHRRRRAAVRGDQLVRLAVLGRPAGHAVDPHGRPRGPPDVRLDADGHHRGAPAGVRGAPLRPLPHRPAGPHRHVLGAGGVLRPADRPRPLAARCSPARSARCWTPVPAAARPELRYGPWLGLPVRGAGWPGCAWGCPRAPSGRACTSWSSSA